VLWRGIESRRRRHGRSGRANVQTNIEMSTSVQRACAAVATAIESRRVDASFS
jgi:hypothetical protein